MIVSATTINRVAERRVARLLDEVYRSSDTDQAMLDIGPRIRDIVNFVHELTGYKIKSPK